jgi:hypothetical protein
MAKIMQVACQWAQFSDIVPLHTICAVIRQYLLWRGWHVSVMWVSTSAPSLWCCPSHPHPKPQVSNGFCFPGCRGIVNFWLHCPLLWMWREHAYMQPCAGMHVSWARCKLPEGRGRIRLPFQAELVLNLHLLSRLLNFKCSVVLWGEILMSLFCGPLSIFLGYVWWNDSNACFAPPPSLPYGPSRWHTLRTELFWLG